MTMIVRLTDALPFAASVEDKIPNDNSGGSVFDYQNQAKQLIKKLTPTSPIRDSVESGIYIFQFVFAYSIYTEKKVH